MNERQTLGAPPLKRQASMFTVVVDDDDQDDLNYCLKPQASPRQFRPPPSVGRRHSCTA
jgi:hypothetical protein